MIEKKLKDTSAKGKYSGNKYSLAMGKASEK
ncbi:MAG: hypothetical protein ACI936_002241 [Paraglaciecola sp.]|jgi:hypothetical protein